MESSKNQITIHDIARELNISASTVSRALHDHPRVSRKTVLKVKNLASKHNYRPNQMAASLRKGRSNTVGVIVPNINRSFFSNIIGGLEEVLSEAGINLIISQSHENLEKEKEAIQTLLNARVDGILMSLAMESQSMDHLDAAEKQVNMIFFDRVPSAKNVNSAVIDDYTAAYGMVNHLYAQGYQKIAHVKGASHINVYAERTRGYLAAIKDLNLIYKEDWVVEAEMTIEGGEVAFDSLMHLPDCPDAILCSGDFVALGILNKANLHKISVPNQLGVTGFANETFTEYITPSLSTVSQKGRELGKNAARLYLENQDAITSKKTHHIVLKPELVFRESTMKR